MNQGMYGMTDGRGMATRKLKAIGGASVTYLASIAAPVAATTCHATAVLGASTPASVRTRLMSIQDRGAVRFFGMIDPGRTVQIELFADGVQVFNRSLATAGAGLHLVVGFGSGSGSTAIALPDYIPFDTSFEVFVTMGAGGTTADYIFNVDLHQ